MMKLLRWTAIVLGVLVLIVGAAGFGVYRAATATPEAYEAALRVDPEQLETQRQELESQITALYSQAQRPAEVEAPQLWQATFTDAQINGWLATRIEEDFPEAMNQGINAPRVLFTEDGLTLAFRVSRAGVDAVILFQVAPFVSEGGELGIELTDAQIGKVPLPPGRIVELSRPLFTQSGLPVEWRQAEGRHTMLVDFEQLASDAQNRRTISTLQYSKGQLHVAGQTQRREPKLARLPDIGIHREAQSVGGLSEAD